MIKKIIDFVFYKRKVSKKDQLHIKMMFRCYFEGVGDWEWGVTPVIDIPINKFEINDIQIYKYKNDIIMKIWLDRPGLLIGRKGRTIDGLQKYMSTSYGNNIIIQLNQSRLWK